MASQFDSLIAQMGIKSPWQETQEMLAQRPQYEGLVDPSTGRLKSQFAINAQPDVGFQAGPAVNTQGLEAIRSRALGTGPSPWETLALQKQGLEEASGIDKAATLGASSRSQALGDLMAKGGASSGARLSLAKSGSLQDLLARQGVLSEGAKARADIGLQGENQKLDLLKSLPGAELSLANYGAGEASRKEANAVGNRDYVTGLQKMNIQNTINDSMAKNAANMGSYKDMMSAWAANKQADATAKAGKK